MTEKTFPLVADDEPMLTPMPQMNLYDDSDLISNIMGDYVEKNYLDWHSIAGNTHAHHPYGQPASTVQAEREPAPKAEKTYAEKAREEARADLKKKRSAAYLRSDSPVKSRNHVLSQGQKTAKPTAKLHKHESGEFAKYGQNLRQEHYILADLPPRYEHQPEPSQGNQPKKNNYDFLKKSQIYNQKERPSKRERKIAQELNLTKLDQKG